MDGYLPTGNYQDIFRPAGKTTLLLPGDSQRNWTVHFLTHAPCVLTGLFCVFFRVRITQMRTRIATDVHCDCFYIVSWNSQWNTAFSVLRKLWPNRAATHSGAFFWVPKREHSEDETPQKSLQMLSVATANVPLQGGFQCSRASKS